MPFAIEWLGAWNHPESKVHIDKEIGRAVGNRTGNITLEIAKASDIVGISMTIRGTGSGILWPGEGWRKHGVLEKRVREVLEGSGRIECQAGKISGKYKPR
jgi:hypothetical protein